MRRRARSLFLGIGGSVAAAGVVLALFLLGRPGAGPDGAGPDSAAEAAASERAPAVVALLDRGIDSVLATFGIDSAAVRKRSYDIPDAGLRRTERIVTIPEAVVPVTVNAALNVMARRHGSRAAATENLRLRTVSIHLDVGGTIVHTVILRRPPRSSAPAGRDPRASRQSPDFPILVRGAGRPGPTSAPAPGRITRTVSQRDLTMAKGSAGQQGLMEKLVSLCKRRGFIFQSSEIYGGLNGAWDYGPLGVELLRNVKNEWWNAMTRRDDVEGLDAAILMHPRVWEASGHVENFTDPMVDCRQCKSRFRLDILFEDTSLKKKKEVLRAAEPERFAGQLADNVVAEEFGRRAESDPAAVLGRLSCPSCGNAGTFTEARKFNLMFRTFVGPVEDSGSVVYLRPETAQGIFVNFLNVQSGSRQKVPFGIAQIGKAFRNEINTKNFLFRTREFEQMEMQFFVKPGSDDEWFEYWRAERMRWFEGLGMAKERLRWHRHEEGKLAHYAKDAYDIEYQFPFGWGEIEGIHNRTDYDLSRHEQFSGKTLKYFDEESKERFTPFIIETSAGASRSFMAFLVNAYREEEAPTAEGGSEVRTVLGLHPRLAPVTAAVFPLVNRDGMPEVARKIEAELRTRHRAFYDDSGAVGRRYRRQDEIGTPFCVTVDSQTLQDQTVTVRERDSMRQERVASQALLSYLHDRMHA